MRFMVDGLLLRGRSARLGSVDSSLQGTGSMGCRRPGCKKGFRRTLAASAFSSSSACSCMQ